MAGENLSEIESLLVRIGQPIVGAWVCDCIDMVLSWYECQMPEDPTPRATLRAIRACRTFPRAENRETVRRLLSSTILSPGFPQVAESDTSPIHPMMRQQAVMQMSMALHKAAIATGITYHHEMMEAQAANAVRTLEICATLGANRDVPIRPEMMFEHLFELVWPETKLNHLAGEMIYALWSGGWSGTLDDLRDVVVELSK